MIIGTLDRKSLVDLSSKIDLLDLASTLNQPQLLELSPK